MNQPSRIVHIHEIRAHMEQMEGQCVRVLGRIKEADVDSSFVVISYSGSDLLVDTSLIGNMEKHSSKSLLQFIGDMEELSGEVNMTGFLQRYTQAANRSLAGSGVARKVVYLNGRIMRNMEGLDVGLYEKALKARRNFPLFFQTPALTPTGAPGPIAAPVPTAVRAPTGAGAPTAARVTAARVPYASIDGYEPIRCPCNVDCHEVAEGEISKTFLDNLGPGILAMIDTFASDFANYRVEMQKEIETLRKQIQAKDMELQAKDKQIEIVTN
ncbi:hypothetical protein HDU98_004667 [Podochytrium sp. JEL0797]|nr:hypothetical protein HDU98_004667 [Podochytrium sp. JEL0797]